MELLPQKLVRVVYKTYVQNSIPCDVEKVFAISAPFSFYFAARSPGITAIFMFVRTYLNSSAAGRDSIVNVTDPLAAES
jgi:hypothetical protein